MTRRTDLQLVSALLDGHDVAGAAAKAMVSYQLADERLTALLERLGQTLGRGVLDKQLHSRRPDRLVAVLRRAPRAIERRVIEAKAVEISPPIELLPAPKPPVATLTVTPIEPAPAPTITTPAAVTPPRQQALVRPAVLPAPARRAPSLGRAPTPAPGPQPVEKPVDPDRALIEAALAAGRVTHLAPGHAAGLTQIEAQLYAAPPPLPEGGWKEVQARRASEALRHRRAAAKVAS